MCSRALTGSFRGPEYERVHQPTSLRRSKPVSDAVSPGVDPSSIFHSPLARAVPFACLFLPQQLAFLLSFYFLHYDSLSCRASAMLRRFLSSIPLITSIIHLSSFSHVSFGFPTNGVANDTAPQPDVSLHMNVSRATSNDSNGSTVIALAAILGTLVLIIFGLAILYCGHRRSKALRRAAELSILHTRTEYEVEEKVVSPAATPDSKATLHDETPSAHRFSIPTLPRSPEPVVLPLFSPPPTPGIAILLKISKLWARQVLVVDERRCWSFSRKLTIQKLVTGLFKMTTTLELARHV